MIRFRPYVAPRTRRHFIAGALLSLSIRAAILRARVRARWHAMRGNLYGNILAEIEVTALRHRLIIGRVK